MTIQEAKQLCRDFLAKKEPADDVRSRYPEALNLLIRETGNPEYMLDLGEFYFERKQFDQALRSYEMAAEADNQYAIVTLGYIWYYGQTGKRDLEKAFTYFEKARQMGDPVAAYHVADMYRDGDFVPRDYRTYKTIIEELYRRTRNACYLNDPLPEVFARLARIRMAEGKYKKALRLYVKARAFLSERIQNRPFPCDLALMKQLVLDTYKLIPFDPEAFGLYDLYYVLPQPAKIRFSFEGAVHEVLSVPARSGPGDPAVPLAYFSPAVYLDARRFDGIDDFFQNAMLEGELLTALYEELTDFTLL